MIVSSKAEPSTAASGHPRIWAIASGKGGVGKSVVASNLGVAFAQRGRRTTLVDLDLGAGNLHTLLGAPPARKNLADFLNHNVETLDDAITRTPIPNLSLIAGDRTSATAANPSYAHKQRLLRHIELLDADDVILDLGAGVGFNTTDFFLAADCGIVVVVPEPTSIENACQFLRAAFFRSLRTVARAEPVRSALELALEQRAEKQLRPLDLLKLVGKIDHDAGRILEACAKRFSTALILNQVREERQSAYGPRIAQECKEYLGAELTYLGAISRCERVQEAVRANQPPLRLFPGSTFASSFSQISKQLLASDRFCLRIGGQKPPTFRKLPCGKIASPLPPLDLDRPGYYLRQCREHLGIELADLAKRTRIRCLQSIELENFDHLPPESYAREFVAQYARALGIQEAKSLATSFAARHRQAAEMALSV